ncbi:MAG: inositol monophosphatase [Treponema sp.]|jgi:myo-inositol-1(or 4)-monophosphatase|nr:inositol monophosphatase [Treponema sp.]
MSELPFIEDILKKTGEYVRTHYVNRRLLPVHSKSHANDFLTEVDINVQKQLVAEIQKTFPGDSILAEESGFSAYPDKPPGRCWAIDPIDGTQNFLRGLFPAFGISLALIEGGVIAAGGVFMPIQGDIFLAAAGKGATKNDKPTRVTGTAELTLARIDIDFNGPVNREEMITRSSRLLRAAGQIRSHACSVVGFCSVASGEQDIYMVLGINAWDIAAGVILVTESGGTVTRFDGSPVNLFDSRKDVLVSNGAMHGLCLEEIKLPG